MDMQLLVAFMQLLGRATWSCGPSVTDNRQGVAVPVGVAGQQPPFGTAGVQQEQQPLHVACSVCGMRPIVGPRLRSCTLFGFNVCVGCAGSKEATAAGPLQEVKCECQRSPGLFSDFKLCSAALIFYFAAVHRTLLTILAIVGCPGNSSTMVCKKRDSA